MLLPCVDLGDNTERSETTQIKSNTLAGTNPEKILTSTEKKMLQVPTDWTNPFGDGKAAQRITQIINEHYQTTKPFKKKY